MQGTVQQYRRSDPVEWIQESDIDGVPLTPAASRIRG